uniref:Uncharacterized protein n=1 Tax=Rhizophora mucronata TaxID=61149 RepID=A0A2P2PEX5_RHIMU
MSKTLYCLIFVPCCLIAKNVNLYTFFNARLLCY